MEKIKNLFGEFRMTWPRVILLAVITAVYTALINQVPFLHDTSFQDIAINLECWFLFAIFIIVNCKTWWEASLKCFVFFLVSQPLIYLIEVPFIGWDIFQYYRYWGIITILTIPGAAIAFLVKKKNWLSVAVLSVANVYLAYACVQYFRSTTSAFPHHLLSSVFCLALAIFFTFVLLEKKPHRIAALAIVVVVMAACLVYTQQNVSDEITLGDGTWSYTVDDPSVVDVEPVDDHQFKVTAKQNGTTMIYFESSNGTRQIANATVSGGGVFINMMDAD
ncbi:MAG: pilus assembly protein N-terminal domain-containing protein [Clostridiales bacterium]|nr:pilus assembly protein N-terminal domain-containing protein [Candidatus Cacconaster stercorequi]